jgi:hypothetical protein
MIVASMRIPPPSAVAKILASVPGWALKATNQAQDQRRARHEAKTTSNAATRSDGATARPWRGRRPRAVQNSKGPPLRAFLSSGGRMWTHFPDRVAYRFVEVRGL